ncbi:MAG TPA: EXLDI protein [Patescibacteria group bacterium]
MPNKTIYVSEGDASLFEEAKNIAGEALSSVIARALREFVSRQQKKAQGMKEISIMVGKADAEQEKRFIGTQIKTWEGFSDDKIWWMRGVIYKTQKSNWVVHLSTIAKATLLTDKKAWKESGDYLINPGKSEITVGQTTKDFDHKLPHELYLILISLMEKEDKPVEYLDI